MINYRSGEHPHFLTMNIQMPLSHEMSLTTWHHTLHAINDNTTDYRISTYI